MRCLDVYCSLDPKATFDYSANNMYIDISLIVLACVVVYLLYGHLKGKERIKKYDAALLQFQKRHGLPPDDPYALEAYYRAMDREIGE